MAVFFRQDTGKSPESETSFLGKLYEKAKRLPENVPVAIRQELAKLSSEINGKTNELKKNTQGNAEQLRMEIKNLARDVTQGYVREGKTSQLKNDARHEKVLSHANSFDKVRAGDILRMRSNGENIAKYLLTDEEGDEVNIETSTLESYKNKTLLVNFGKNNSMNASIGLGDILPYEVKKVEITKPNGETVVGVLGSEDSRKGRKERVGYYDVTNGKYIAIYSGYKVAIRELYTQSEQATKDFSTLRAKFDTIQNNHLTELRLKEMMEICIVKNGYKKATPEEVKNLLETEFRDERDQALFSQVSEKINDHIIRGMHIYESYKDAIGTRDKFIGKYGWYLRDVIKKDFPELPVFMLVNLFDKESDPRGRFDPTAHNSSGAYGLGQMRPAAWADTEEHTNMKYDRSSPYDQIHAAAGYLNLIMKKNNCDIKDAIVYYHMGPNVYTEFIAPNNINALENYKKSNPVIAKEMKTDSWSGYMAAARYYYTEEPTLLSTLDLSATGTELSSQLGDFVMSTSLPNTGNNSCGAAVGELLNRFGIQKLPQDGRDGKNWDEILEPRVLSGQFQKKPIRHPDEASAGAILVFDEGADKAPSGSLRDLYGHVEIKGSDGKYYSYYKGTDSAGSARTNVTEPEAYRKLTGFTGYAYYPVAKTL